VVAAGCGGGGHSSPSTSATLTRFQIRPLTAEVNDRTVQWKLTAHVTGPGKVSEGHLRVKPAGAALKPGPGRLPARQGSSRRVTPAETTCSLDGECTVELTRTTCASEHECDVEGVWRVDRPPSGRYERRVAFVAPDAATSNEITFVVDVKDAPAAAAPPPPSAPPPAPPSFAETIGASFRHPRCSNCHGFQVPNVVGRVHFNRPTTCSGCHPVPGWHAPAASFALTSKSFRQICEMVKISRANDAARIEEHLKHDSLILWAITNGIVEGALQPGGLAPPGDLGAWYSRIDQWMRGGMSCG
jgi:hypothetical protein